jgi:hypothetical protein
MEQRNANDDAIVEQVERILDELIEQVALRVAAAGGGAVDGGVHAWWRGQYKAKFFYAIRVKGRVFDNDRPVLLKKAEELGKVARDLAGVGSVTTLHAAMASHQVDCPPIGGLEDWCN